ncbi:pilus assembly protein PilM [Candidatus Uhrbacteria bacterium]|nr:pilus assembly protein PilM [Candidatus Uhrbacteria bacterium]
MSFLDQYTSGLGVDISEHHVRFAKVNVLNQVQWLHEITLPEGLVVDERVVKAEELKKIIEDTLKKTPIVESRLKTTLLMPESRVFSTSFLLEEGLEQKTFTREALLRAQRDIPVPFEQAQTTISKGGRENGKTRTTVYTVEKNVFDSFKTAFDLSYFQLVAAEANTKALWRLLRYLGSKEAFPKKENQLVGIVDIGNSWINISVYTANGATLYSRSISYSGSSQKAVESIVETMKEIVIYFSQEKREIVSFILAGVEAEDKKIEEKNLMIKKIGEVVKVASHSSKEIHMYGAALGAALRTVHLRRDAYQHNFLTH